MSSFDRIEREGVDVEVAFHAAARSVKTTGRTSALTSVVRSPIGAVVVRPWLAFRKARSRIPARLKGMARPFLLPLRRFFMAPLEAELREVRAQVEELQRSSLVPVPTGDGGVLVRTAVGYVVCDPTDDRALAALLETGEFERESRMLVERLLRPGDVFIDVGADLGLLTLAASRAMRRSGAIHAFERREARARRLRETIALNGLTDLVQLHSTLSSSRDAGGPRDPASDGSGASAMPSSFAAATLDLALVSEPGVAVINIGVDEIIDDVIRGAKAVIGRSPDVAVLVTLNNQPGSGPRLSDDWFEPFQALGLEFRVVDRNTGRLRDHTTQDEQESMAIKLVLSRPGSNAWLRAGAGSSRRKRLARQTE